MSAYDKTSIQINRCKRILVLVDDYAEKMTSDTRTTLRKALMEEFETTSIAPPVAAGSVDTVEFNDPLADYVISRVLHKPDTMERRDRLIERINAWGAQQREAGQRYGWDQCATLNQEAIRQQRERAEKAEARVAELEREKLAPSCDCHQCKPLSFENNRMILCATCGNKRCPHANDHRNACTGSNELGQAGSAYA